VNMNLGSRRRGEWQGMKVCQKFRGADKGSTQLMSPLGNEEVFLTTEKAASFKMGVGGVSVSEGVLKLTMEVFTFIVIPHVHGAVSSFEGR
jgi:hypothetical protein